MDKTKVAIIGSGNIGTDLLIKIIRSPYLECTMFIGRNANSPGMLKARSLGIPTYDKGIHSIIMNPALCDVVFDATSALNHRDHAPILKALGKFVIDMTPSNMGEMCVPTINLQECLELDNVNMITCGGQAALPIAYAIGQSQKHVDYIEVVSSISSKSAGPATRINLDEYIETTEEALKHFSGCARAKAILNLNPANPCIDMQTTIFALVDHPDMDALLSAVNEMIALIQSYVPGYQMIVPPTTENGRIVVMIKVQGLGDYLPRYAGNLDIINCAAIAIAEAYAKNRNAKAGV